LAGLKELPREALLTLALLLSPFAPHLGEEIWQRLGHERSLAFEPWPEFDPALIHEETVEIGVQVDGRLRGTVTLPTDADEETALAGALAEPRVFAFLKGRAAKKVVYVKGKIINLIL
jgi:leucyl-tRNA synthetase